VIKKYAPNHKKNSVSYFKNSSWTAVLVSKKGKMVDWNFTQNSTVFGIIFSDLKRKK